MKAILISIKPQWVAKILNGEKTIEIRKRFPSDYVGWVYIYVTKGDKNTCLEYADNPNKNKEGKWCITSGYPYANGRVVARFWCDNVNKFYDFDDDLCEEACLDRGEILDYLGEELGKAIHITKLEIFDYPKEIYEMKRLEHFGIRNKCGMLVPLTRAPQSWCYVEV